MKIIEKYMQSFFEEQNLTYNNEINCFEKEGFKAKVSYNETKKLAVLSVDKGENFKPVATYLFEDTENEKDAECVAIDFIETLNEELGLKKTVKRTAALPTAEKSDVANLTSLTQKLLAIYPERKETYLAQVEKYGKFLPINFIKEYFASDVKGTLTSGNKKSIKKLCDALTELYTSADGETMGVITAIFAAAVYGDENLITALKDQTADCTHLYTSVLNMLQELKTSKKLRAALLK